MASAGLLDGRLALVTGSTRGIGWATARAFAREGATVVLNGRSDQGLLDARVVELREEFGGEPAALLCDVSDPAAVRGAFQELFRRYRKLDVLVNNAGILQDALIGMIPEQLVRDTLAVNTAGPLYCLQEAARLMGRAKRGSIVNVTSIMGRVGAEGLSVYAASKAGVIGMTLAAAKELAPKGIRVNAVAPGFIRTDMASALTPAKHADRVASVRMGRVGEPDEVADAIVFLASDRSTYVTGQVIGVDGGMVV